MHFEIAARRAAPCLAVILILTPYLEALDPDKSITQYMQRVWQTEQGLPQNSVSSSQAAHVLTQVGDALTSAHAAGVIHRDLKPANLFLVPVDGRFQVKLVDFGLAKSMREDAALTRTGVLVGSPSYMSPEQVRGQVMNQRSDLFSLACVTYEILTGTVAFSAESVPDVLMRVLMEQPAPLSSRFAHELDELIIWALRKNPHDRPTTVAEWVEKIVPVLATSASSARGWEAGALSSEIVMPGDSGTSTAEIDL